MYLHGVKNLEFLQRLCVGFWGCHSGLIEFNKNRNISHSQYNVDHTDTRGVQKVCGLTMKEEIYKGHSMYENTTSQYKNIYREKKKISLPFLHILLEVAYPETRKN